MKIRIKRSPLTMVELRTLVVEQKLEFERMVARYIVDHPDIGYLDIGRRFRMHEVDVANIATKHGVTRRRGQKPRIK